MTTPVSETAPTTINVDYQKRTATLKGGPEGKTYVINIFAAHMVPVATIAKAAVANLQKRALEEFHEAANVTYNSSAPLKPQSKRTSSYHV